MSNWFIIKLGILSLSPIFVPILSMVAGFIWMESKGKKRITVCLWTLVISILFLTGIFYLTNQPDTSDKTMVFLLAAEIIISFFIPTAISGFSQ